MTIVINSENSMLKKTQGQKCSQLKPMYVLQNSANCNDIDLIFLKSYYTHYELLLHMWQIQLDLHNWFYRSMHIWYCCNCM